MAEGGILLDRFHREEHEQLERQNRGREFSHGGPRHMCRERGDPVAADAERARQRISKQAERDHQGYDPRGEQNGRESLVAICAKSAYDDAGPGEGRDHTMPERCSAKRGDRDEGEREESHGHPSFLGTRKKVLAWARWPRGFDRSSRAIQRRWHL